MAQEFPQPLENEAEVVADGAHDGVDVVAEAAVQEVAAEMAVGLAVSDDRFDGGSSSQLLFDLSVDAAFLPRAEDPARFRRLVADISFVDIGPLDLAAGQRLGLLDDRLQGVTVVWITGERLGVEDELAALAAFVGGGERDLDAELVGFVRLAPSS